MRIGCLTICIIFSFILCVLKIVGLINITWAQSFMPLFIWFGVVLLVCLLVGLIAVFSLLFYYLTSKDKNATLEDLNKQLRELENELKNRKW